MTKCSSGIQLGGHTGSEQNQEDFFSTSDFLGIFVSLSVWFWGLFRLEELYIKVNTNWALIQIRAHDGAGSKFDYVAVPGGQALE